MERTRVNKRFGKFDKLIDLSLVKDPFQRISWTEFMNIYYEKQVSPMNMIK